MYKDITEETQASFKGFKLLASANDYLYLQVPDTEEGFFRLSWEDDQGDIMPEGGISLEKEDLEKVIKLCQAALGESNNV